VLGKIGRKVGYPKLEEQLLDAYRFFPKEGQALSPDEILELLRDLWKGDVPDALPEIANKFLDLLGENRSFDSMVRIADGLKEILGDGIENHALVDAWLSSHLLRDLGLPQAVLQHIGDQAQDWEKELPLYLRARLWTERSNALRMNGRGQEALAIAKKVIEDLEAEGEEIPRSLQRNLGILYRESGRHKQALDIFLGLLRDDGRDFDLLHSIVVTYTSVGRIAEAIPYLETMSELAQGPYADKHAAIVASLAGAKAAIGERNEALELLRSIPTNSFDNVEVLVPYASAWSALSDMRYDEKLDEKDYQAMLSLIPKLEIAYHAKRDGGNTLMSLTINRLLAHIVDLTQVVDSSTYWRQLNEDARKFEGVPDPMALLALARDAWTEGQHQKGKEYLVELPESVAARYLLEGDISLKIQSLTGLHSLFADLLGLADNSGSIEDLRLIAELKRDMFGRIRMASFRDELVTTGFIEPNYSEIGLLGGPTIVFEWVDGGDSLYSLATFIDVDGTVSEFHQSLFKEFEIDDLNLLAERITQRLSVWHPGRAGSPLDLKEWRSFENWLSKELDDRLPTGGHIVVIEHEAMAGLQWHIAAAPKWYVSYAPSWSAILHTRKLDAPSKKGAIGLAMVPKYRESDGNLQALESSIERTEQLAARLEVPLKSALHEACDREALIALLEGTMVTKVLCHGFVDPDEDVVALMLAYHGELPLANSVAANTEVGRKHRFDWQGLWELRNGPSYIFSAACSSGQSHHRGLGEKVGIFSNLRGAGTRSYVAPRWDIDPKVVLPILDDIIERFLLTECEIGEALHAACSEAGTNLPRWQAWALALEGDWK